MIPLSSRCSAVLVFLFLATGFCRSGERPTARSVQTLYDQAVHVYSAGLFSDALDLFLQVQAEAGPYRETHGYIARCAESLSIQRDTAITSAVVERARGMLALRESALGDLAKRGGVRVAVEGESHSLQCPAGFFMDDLAWDALNAFIATVPGAWVTVRAERNSESPRANGRDALLLAERLVREGGVPAERLFLRARPGTGSGLTILVSPRKPIFGAEDREVPGVLVRAEKSEYRLGETDPLAFYLLMLTPEKSRRWRLDLLDERGTVVRAFEGSPTVLNHVRWDGRDEKDQRVLPGTYGARFSVSGWTEGVWTDTAPFIVLPPEIPTKPQAALPPEPSLPVRRQHRFVIHFQENAAVPLERERDMAARVAYVLTINPEKKVIVMGGAGAGEKTPNDLAVQRADWVRGELVRLGIPARGIRVGDPSRDEGAAVVVAFEE